MHASMTEKLKQNAEQYRVREGSPVGKRGRQDLWWEEFVKQISFKSGMEERGWYDGIVTDDERG